MKLPSGRFEIPRTHVSRRNEQYFSCGVIAGRWAKLSSLNSILSGKQGCLWNIEKYRERKRKRYETLSNQMTCDENRPPNSATGVVERLMKSSMEEYCRYTYYLDYLDANLRENFSSVQIQKPKSGTEILKTTTNTKVLKRTNKPWQNDRRWNWSKRGPPKAIIAFQKWIITYVVHVMLTFLYDYLKLEVSSTYLLK